MSRRSIPPALAALGLGACAVALLGGAASPAAPADGFEAKSFYAATCAGCHGAAGEGGFGPDLTKVEAKGDPFIATRIRQGSPKGMPPYAEQLKPAELKALVAYVKRL